MNYIGIDPGQNGGLVCIDDTKTVILRYAFKKSAEKYIDILDFIKHLQMISERNAIVILEDVHSIFGMSAKSNFSFGYICGLLYGIIKCLNYECIKVQPKVWQKEILGDMEKIKKANLKSNDTKKMALIKSIELFPEFNNLATPRCSKPHDGLIDALLIAEYGRRINDKLR